MKSNPTQPRSASERSARLARLVASMALWTMVLLLPIVSAQTYVAIGTANGSNSGTSYPTPFGDYYESNRAQYLYRASELTAAGIAPGSSISAIRWNVTALNGSGSHEAYTVKVGTTTTASLGAAYLASPATIYGPTNYTPVVGNNTFPLGTPITWNGTDNILVEICHSSNLASLLTTYTSNATVAWQSGLAFNGSYHRYQDNINTACSSTTLTNTATQTTRPQIILGYTAPISGCTNVVYSSPYPAATFTPTCTGAAQDVGGVTNCYAGEYSNVALTSGVTYTFSSSTAGDFLTITNAGGTTVVAAGTSPINWTATATATYRYYTHTSGPAGCGTAAVNRARRILCNITGCTNVAYSSPYPAATYTPACTGAAESITGLGYAGEYSNVALTSGTSYTFTSSTGTDFITITNAAGSTTVAAGVTPVTWVANATATFRFFTHTGGPPGCGTAAVSRTRSVTCTQPPPANDACANAINVSAYPYTSSAINNGGATTDGPVTTCDGPYKNVWWRVTGVCGTMTATTCTSGFDTEMAVYTGSCASLTPVTCNDDAAAGPCSGTLQSYVTWTATQGTFYWISAGSYFNAGATGSIVLNVTAADTDGDGIGNACDNCPSVSNAAQTNTDGDAFGDACDSDDDNDGIADGSDPSPLNPDICGDADGDGCDDCSVGTDNFGPLADNLVNNDGTDTDGDGLCDFGDPDDDNDGVADASDPNDGDPDVCGDADGDGCDDCSVGTDGFGPLADNNTANDGPDADADGICDSSDNCVSDSNPGQANADGDALGDQCDPCNNVANTNPGAGCNDGNPLTVLDTYVQSGSVPNATCACVGTACTTNLNLVFTTDGVTNIGWELRTQGTNILVQSGGGVYPASPGYSISTCLPNGDFYLRVTSNLGGIVQGGVQGGYQLLASGTRIIDNRNNFLTGATSQIAGGEGFSLPLGTDKLIYASCDKLDWRNNEFIVANNNPLVDAQWGVNDANSGYEMWWYNPNGGYSFRRFHSHAVSDGFAPANASRACHIQINNWGVANHIPTGVLLNVKVRGRVNGTNQAWGRACRFILDPVRAQCPLTKLMDYPGNQYLACGGTRPIGNGQNALVHARPVTRLNGNVVQSANKYQFRFRIPAENFSLTKTSQTGQYWVNTVGLSACKSYEVDVRASFDNGATWCTDWVMPFLTDPWGDVCILNTACADDGGGQNMAAEDITSLNLYPNPNRGDQVVLTMDRVEEGVHTVSVDFFDTFGKRVSGRTIAVADGFVNSIIELNGELAAGMYLVNITAGTSVHTQRLVIEP